MSGASQVGRPEQCLSDFAIDELVASRSLGVEAAPVSVRHLAGCSRCAERLAEFEAVEPPPLPATGPSAKTGTSRRFVTPMSAALAGLVVLGGLWALLSRGTPSAGENTIAAVDTATRTKGALALVAVVRDASGNVRRITPTDVVHPGESLRFELTPSQPGYAGVVGLDAAGATTVYAPAQGSLTWLTGGAPIALPDAIVMDETLGSERLVAVLCSEPLTVEQLKAAAERALRAAGGDPTSTTRLDLPCGQATADLRKQPLP